jgi:hypothetical protein
MSSSPPIPFQRDIIAGDGLTLTGSTMATSFDPDIVTDVAAKKASAYVLLSNTFTTGTSQPTSLADSLFIYNVAGGAVNGNGTLGVVSGSFASSGAETGTGSGQAGLGSTVSATQPYNITDFPGQRNITVQLRTVDGDDVLVSDLLSSITGADASTKVYCYLSYRSDLGADLKWRLWYYYRRSSDGFQTPFTPDLTIANASLYAPIIYELLSLPVGAGLGGPIVDGDAAAVLGPKSVGTAELDDLAVTTIKIAGGAVTAAKLASTAVTPGSYTSTNLTVDQQGRITAAASGSAGPSLPLSLANGGFGQAVNTGLTNDYVAIVAGGAITIGAVTSASLTTALTTSPPITLTAGNSITMSAGSGALALGSGTGNWTMPTGSGSWSGAAGKSITLTEGVASSGTSTGFTYTGGAHTALTASTEVIAVNYNLAQTVQHATGALTTQRAFVVQAPTYSFVASSTLTKAATFAITGAPVTGTNATITNAYALWVQAGKSQFDGNVTIANGNTLTLPGSVSGPGGGSYLTFTNNTGAIELIASSKTYLSLNGTNTNAITFGANIDFITTAGTGGINFGAMTGDVSLPTGSISWSGASSKTVSISTSSGGSLSLTSNATVSGSTAALSGTSSAQIQHNGTALITTTSTSILQMAANKAFNAAAGTGSFGWGSATGDFTFPTGAVAWTGASGKTLILTGSGTGAITINAGTSGTTFQRSSTTLLDIGATTSTAVTLATGKTLAAGSNVLIGSVTDKLNAAMLAIASQATGDVLYADTTTTFARLAKGSDGQVLTLASGVPSWAAATGTPVNVISVTPGLSSISSAASWYPNGPTFLQTANEASGWLMYAPSGSTWKIRMSVDSSVPNPQTLTMQARFCATINGTWSDLGTAITRVNADGTAVAESAVLTPGSAGYITFKITYSSASAMTSYSHFELDRLS